MAFAFDTLGYAKRLRDAGVPAKEAEAHAEAAREFIMTELVTKSDLDVTRRELEASMDIREQHLTALITTTRHELETRIHRLESRFEAMELRLTIRMGGMMAIAVAILAALIKF
ncbi:MAG TPA: hypothetical protein VMB73_34560 [Acetobacteraceae bacterium]|jgi:hypothetical protein|nr:hypothetical protein [Acetobacteraceae bacterium]